MRTVTKVHYAVSGMKRIAPVSVAAFLFQTSKRHQSLIFLMNQQNLVNHCYQQGCKMSSVAKKEFELTDNCTNEKSNKYIVSRNGVILSWHEIYQQYPLANNDSSSSSATKEPSYEPMEASSLLQRLPRGAYTTCRTVKKGTHIYQFDYHVKRLAVSSASILQSVASAAASFAAEDVSKNTKPNLQVDLLSKTNHPRHHPRNPSTLESQSLNIIKEGWEREMALNCIRLTLDAFRSTYTQDTTSSEFRITLLATWEQQMNDDNPFKSVLYCHVGLLLPNKNDATSSKGLQNQNVRVLVHGHGRTNASAKDSKWVTDRKQLLLSSCNNNGYEEIILMNDKGELLEGTQTNFYVVSNTHTIVTANEGVLFGSVRDSVLRVCQQHGIAVELRAPTLEDLKCATGVFITSTSRWVMPVHEVDLGDLLLLNRISCSTDSSSGSVDESFDADVTRYQYHNCPTTDKIRIWVLEDVETHSTLINA